MKTVATLGPSVRLVIFQFLMKSAQVPAIIPIKRASIVPPLPPVSGVEVLPSTPKLHVFPLATRVACHPDYELVDTWKKPHESNWAMSFVRFVFCHKEHVNQDELFPEFVSKKSQFEQVFADFVTDNLWATQGHLNPYIEKGGTITGQDVLMFGCAGRIPNTMLFSGGRDENNRGIGPKVLLSTRSSSLNMFLLSNEVVLMGPQPIPDPESLPASV